MYAQVAAYDLCRFSAVLCVVVPPAGDLLPVSLFTHILNILKINQTISHHAAWQKYDAMNGRIAQSNIIQFSLGERGLEEGNLTFSFFSKFSFIYSNFSNVTSSGLPKP